MDTITKYYVRYQVDGFGEQEAGPYDSEAEAETHRQDIAGFEGVQDARVREHEDITF